MVRDHADLFQHLVYLVFLFYYISVDGAQHSVNNELAAIRQDQHGDDSNRVRGLTLTRNQTVFQTKRVQ